MGEGPPAGLRSRRVPGPLRRSPRRPRGAVQQAHAPAGGARPREGRPPRPRVVDGRPAHRAAAVGLDPAPHRAARDQAQARRRTHRHGARGRPERQEAAAPRDPALRQRHELRRAERRGQGRAGPRGRGRRHRHLLGRRRDAPRRAGRVLAVLLRARVRQVRLEHRQGAARAGVSFQGRTGRQDGDGRSPPGRQGGGKDRRRARSDAGHAGREPRHVLGPDDAGGLPTRRRRGARGVGRDPDRLQAQRAAHRGRHRLRARRVGRLHHPRRQGRRHRRRARDLQEQHLGPHHGGARARAPTPRPRPARPPPPRATPP